MSTNITIGLLCEYIADVADEGNSEALRLASLAELLDALEAFENVLNLNAVPRHELIEAGKILRDVADYPNVGTYTRLKKFFKAHTPVPGALCRPEGLMYRLYM